MPATSAPKDYQKLYEDQKKINDDYHDKLVTRDELILTAKAVTEQLQDDLRSETAKNKSLVANVESLEQDIKKHVDYITDLQKETDKLRNDLSGEKKLTGQLQDWNITTESTLGDRDNELKTLRDEHAILQSDLQTAHSEIDKLTNANADLAERVQKNDDAAEYLHVVNERFEHVFQGIGEKLTPDGLNEHLRRLGEQAELNRESSELSLNEQYQQSQPTSTKPTRPERARQARQTSMSHELARATAAENDSEDNSGDSADATDEVEALRHKLEEAENGRKAAEKQVESILSTMRRNEEARKTQTQRDQELNEENKTLDKQKKENSEKLSQRVKELTDQTKTLRDQNKALIDQNKALSERDNTKHQQSDQPSQEARARIVHKVHTRDATIYEAVCNATFWQKLMLMLLFLFLSIMGYSGWAERRLWHQANSSAWHNLQYSNSAPMIMGWQYWLEEIAGINTKLLG